MDEADRQVLENIKRFGCQVMHIAAEDDLPPFAYSIVWFRLSERQTGSTENSNEQHNYVFNRTR